MLNKTLFKITSLLQDHKIPYMVIGGYAVLYHGEARFTEDIDIVLGVDNDDLNHVLEIVSHDFQGRTENMEDFVTKTNVLPLKEKEFGVKVDLIFSFIEFERQAIRNAVKAEIEGKIVNIVKAEDLIIYKLLAGRPKDFEDAKAVFQINRENINIVEIEENVIRFSQMMGNEMLKKWQEIKNK